MTWTASGPTREHPNACRRLRSNSSLRKFSASEGKLVLPYNARAQSSPASICSSSFRRANQSDLPASLPDAIRREEYETENQSRWRLAGSPRFPDENSQLPTSILQIV